MVVIAIIGILSAIAVPSYRTYVAKAQITEVIVILQSLMQTGINAYQTTGSVQSNLVFGGTTYPVGSFANFNGSNYINQIKYMTTGYGATAGLMTICLTLKNINSPGLSEICMAVSESNDILKLYCGVYSGTSSVLTYLPQGCTCLNIMSLSC
jgi:Tfp pilus assembly protein PilE